GEPRGVVAAAPAGRRALAGHGLRGIPAPSRLDEARRRAAEEGARAFDLARDPMLGTALFTLGDAGHGLVVTLHHIRGDGWSVGVLVQELAALYAAFAAGRASPLPELELQYADYAAWQRRQLVERGELLRTQTAYWRGRLAGASPLDLPWSRTRPAALAHE